MSYLTVLWLTLRLHTCHTSSSHSHSSLVLHFKLFLMRGPPKPWLSVGFLVFGFCVWHWRWCPKQLPYLFTLRNRICFLSNETLFNKGRSCLFNWCFKFLGIMSPLPNQSSVSCFLWFFRWVIYSSFYPYSLLLVKPLPAHSVAWKLGLVELPH